MAKREKFTIEDNDGKYIVERGTYLPAAKRIADLKAAGMDLMAYRQAYADFSTGTKELKLSEYVDELKNIDEIDFFKKRERYFNIMKQAAEQQAQKIKEFEKAQQEKIINDEVARRIQEKKDVIDGK